MADKTKLGSIGLGWWGNTLADAASQSREVASAAIAVYAVDSTEQGAVVLTEGGDVAGAVGVSGATADEDEEIARAGAAALGG